MELSLALSADGFTDDLKEEQPMLVLTRRAGESIHIGSDIVVSVLEVTGYRVRLGITAPREVPVCRAELVVSLDAHRTQMLTFVPQGSRE
jgi:carbon storage regulator